VYQNHRRRSDDELWQEYVHGKQTYSQLARREKTSSRGIQRRLDDVQVHYSGSHGTPGQAIILMDTAYFSRGSGLMVWRDERRKKNLHRIYVRYETVVAYKAGIELLKEQGWEILAIVCDGRRGLLGGFPGIPTQMCQFHQMQIVTRYITNRPKLEAGKELKEVVSKLVETDKASFTGWLDQWYEKWADFLKEKSINPVTGKSGFTHQRLRSAYFSLRRNLRYLFTFEDYFELGIPNTTNGLEGTFSNLTKKLGVHNGLREKRKQKVIDTLLFD